MSESEVADVLETLAEDFRAAKISPAQKAMLSYARKLTDSPQQIVKQDVDQLRDVGFDDRQIHDVCAITSYFAFVNRIADGLGVELEN